jgi:hypothetical protein
MKTSKSVLRGLLWGLATLFLLGLLGISLAQDVSALRSEGEPLKNPQSGTYDLSWWTVDGGGTNSAEANGYALGSTIGQPDAAVWSGGDYVLAGGFWGGVAVEYRVYLPLILRNT